MSTHKHDGNTQAAPAAPASAPSQAPRGKAHWTPRYIADRLRWGWWQRRHPQDPWLVPEAVMFLEQWLRTDDVMVEFGSGRSTRWFARHVGRVISIEDHRAWYDEVTRQLASAGLRNVTYCFAGPTPEEYIQAAREAAPAPADFILVDGSHRDHCAMWALAAIKPGGVIAVDNANWYMPHATRSPSSVGSGPAASPLWQQFVNQTKSWRCLWYSSGVTDTAVFFAPPRA